MVNRALILAGIFTLGAYFGATQEQASASSIVLPDTLITSSVPTDACTEFRLNDDDSATCFDGDIAGTYSVDNYAISPDTDGPGFRLTVWR